MFKQFRLFAAISSMAMVIGANAVQADEVKVLAANAVKGPLLECETAFEKAIGHKVTIIWSGSTASAKRIRAGDVVDIVIISSRNIDKLISEGKLAEGSRVDFLKSRVGMAVRTGLPKPEISSGEAVKSAVLAAKSVAYSSGPSGNEVVRLFEKMGIADQIKHKVIQTPSGVQVGELVARGDADLGF